MAERAILCWSGGKDCARALHELRRAGEVEVAGLLTTVSEEYGRVSMHGVRRALLEVQARALALPLTVVEVPAGAGNGVYEARMGAALRALREEGVGAVAFGDLFLEEVRRYREERLAPAGMEPLFPLWGRPTDAVAEECLALGFRAVAACVDGEALDGAFAGRDYDAAFLRELPAGVDPCGENGEFHTFVHDGPGFAAPVPFRRGDVVLRDGRFWYCDLLPAGAEAPYSGGKPEPVVPRADVTPPGATAARAEG